MGRFAITGKKVVSGVHRVPGNKNAALPMIAAALLTSEPVTLENVPDIADVASMLECARSFGASVVRKPHSSTVTIRAEKLKTARLDPVLGAKAKYSKNRLVLASGKGGCANLKGASIILDEASVTATENIIMAAALADEWPHEETVIEGALDTSGENGIGPNAMRCVYVHEGGYVRGFKLTNGRTKKDANGGGATLLGGALIDCEITGNGCDKSGRAVSVSSEGDIKPSHGMIIRCKIYDQVVGGYEIYNGTVVDSYAECSEDSYVYYGIGKILNCTLFGKSVRTNMQKLQIINTYLSGVSAVTSSVNTIFCTNCIFTSSSDTAIVAKRNCFYDEATCRFSVKKADNLDDNFRPKYSASPLVDAGSKALYDANFPSKWVQFKEGDLRGGQRIYNAKIDVGCGEYDWRGDFASMLGTKAAISEMGENVTVDSASDIVVPEGDSIALSMPPRSPGRTTKYELTYTPEGGEATVVTEVSTEAFSYVLAGPCTVQSLTRNGNFTITIR